MTSKPKMPKDLGIKVGSKREVFWTQVYDAAVLQIEDAKKTVLLQEGVAEMALKKITREKDKFK